MLRRPSRELDWSLERAHIYVSCRVSDWKGQEDRTAVEGFLPVREKPASLSAEADADLFDPSLTSLLSWTSTGYLGPDRRIHASIQQILFEVVTGKELESIATFDRGLRLLARLDLDQGRRRRIADLACRRLHSSRAREEDPYANRCLEMLFLANADGAVVELVDWLEKTPAALRDTRAEQFFGTVFGRLGELATNALTDASVLSLDKLLRLAWRFIRQEDDTVLVGGNQDWHPRMDAEGARGVILRALLDRPGVDAYQAVRRLAADEPSWGKALGPHRTGVQQGRARCGTSGMGAFRGA